MFWAIVHLIQSCYNFNPIAWPSFLHICGELKYIIFFIMLESMLWSLILFDKRSKFVFAKKIEILWFKEFDVELQEM